MKKLFAFLTKLFFNNKDDVIEMNNEESVKEEITNPIDNVSLKIKTINWELIRRLNKYDIVFVKMTNSEIEHYNIEKTHQQRPFLIIEKKDEEEIACGYYFTSNIANNPFFKKENHRNLKLVLNADDYALNKNSLVLFNNEITLPYENIIHWIDHISPSDLKKLKKYRNLLYDLSASSSQKNKTIEIGDIILDNDINYIIYQTDNTNCYGYPISKFSGYVNLERDHNYILVNKQLYFIDYQNCKVFKNNDTFRFVNRLNTETVELIRKNKKQIKYEQKNKCKKKKR